MSRKAYVLIGLFVGVSLLLAGVWSAVQSTTIVALRISYPGITMRGYGGRIGKVSVVPKDFAESSQPVFVSIKNVPVRALVELREADIQKNPSFTKVQWIEGVQRRGTSYSDNHGNLFTFEDERLVYLSLRWPTNGIRISSSAEGPFIQLPMSEAQVKTVFGPPAEIKRTREWRSIYPWGQ